MSTWFDQAREIAVVDVAAALGLDVRGDHQSFGPCPGCGEATRANKGRRDRRGRCTVFAGGRAWKCRSNGSDGCGAQGDGLALASLVTAGQPHRELDSHEDWRPVRDFYAQYGWCDPEEDRPAPVRVPRKLPPARREDPSGQRPPLEEVLRLWAASVPVDRDAEGAAWIRLRGWDPVAFAALDLVRVIPADAELPRWAAYRDRVPWTQSGHRLLIRAFEPDPDEPGRLRWASLHARNLQADCDPGDKAAWPAMGTGSGAGLVMACGDDLAHEGAERRLVVVAEGVPDFLEWAHRPGRDYSVLGVWSGSATPGVAELVPDGWDVALRQHADKSGEDYARKLASLLPRGCKRHRLQPDETGRDDVARRQSGAPAADPMDGTIVQVELEPGGEPPDRDIPPPDDEGAPADDRPPLDRDSDVALARELLSDLRAEGEPLVHDEGSLHRFDVPTGVWVPVPISEQWVSVAGQDGRLVVTGRTPKGGMKLGRLRISANRVAGVVKMTAHLAARPGFFAETPPGLTFSNGHVLVTADEVRVVPLGPEHRCRAVLPASYEPGASRERWERFLGEVLAPDADILNTARTLQEFLGACLLGIATRYERCLVLTGVGANGKSVMLEVFAALFPCEARAAIAPQQFDRDFKLALLAGKLFNVVNEVPNADLAASERFKAVVSGNLVTAERKHQDPFTFRPRAGHAYACNALWGTSDASDGYYRRFLLVPLLRQFEESEQEKGLGNKLIQEELPGIAAWAIEGAQRLLRQDRYTVSRTSKEASEEWRTDSDSVRRWVRECTHAAKDAKGWMTPLALYRAYSEWSAERGYIRMTETTFGRRIKLAGVAWRRLAAGVQYGVALLTDFDREQARQKAEELARQSLECMQ